VGIEGTMLMTPDYLRREIIGCLEAARRHRDKAHAGRLIAFAIQCQQLLLDLERRSRQFDQAVAAD